MMLPKIFKFRKIESKIEPSGTENRASRKQTLAELGVFMSEDDFKLKISELKANKISVLNMFEL